METKLYKMQVGDQFTDPKTGFIITAVPGGWIFILERVSTFVPRPAVPADITICDPSTDPNRIVLPKKKEPKNVRDVN